MMVSPVVAKVIMTATINPIIWKHCLLFSMVINRPHSNFRSLWLKLFYRDFLTWKDIRKLFASTGFDSRNSLV